MKLFNWLPYFFLALVLPVLAKKKAPENLVKQPPKRLVIETVYKPKECPTKAKRGDAIEIHYTGTLFTNGRKFDSSHDRDYPLHLTLGDGQVIPGWEKGLKGMCLHEKRKLTIPPDLAYGKKGMGAIIPPKATVIYDVELVGLTRGGKKKEL